MNLVRKLKLKAVLRNCDYALAGAAIKQQYYDEHKDTIINRLIDQYLMNPGFEESLKLIEYNDMMIFYFTESCEGGLYVRKTVQEPNVQQDVNQKEVKPSNVEKYPLSSSPLPPRTTKIPKNIVKEAPFEPSPTLETPIMEKPHEKDEIPKFRHVEEPVEALLDEPLVKSHDESFVIPLDESYVKPLDEPFVESIMEPLAVPLVESLVEPHVERQEEPLMTPLDEPSSEKRAMEFSDELTNEETKIYSCKNSLRI